MSLLPINQVVDFDVSTYSPTTAALTDADSTPTFDVVPQGSRTPILASQAMTHDTTGVYYGRFTCSVANGFAAGTTYQVKVKATVGGISGNECAMRFRISPAESSAGVAKADVSHFGGTAGTFTTGRPEVDLNSSANTELTAVPAAGAKTLDMIKWNFLLARNKITQTATQTLVKANDGSTTVGSSTISDDGTTFTRGAMG